jgi:ribonuclease HII
MANLNQYYKKNVLEAGCDEAGRGCLAGPVFAASVILPDGYHHPLLNDSKKVNPLNREKLRADIEKSALFFAVAMCTNDEIDKINILNASILAMHRALEAMTMAPEHIIVDGNKFKKFYEIPHTCIIKGDSLYTSIAAASILAKTYRDEYMRNLHLDFPVYHWNNNKGYPTIEHRRAILKYGLCMHHRKSFNTNYSQLSLSFDDVS